MTDNRAESYLDHPMFQQALESMQKGDWEAGINQIEKLMEIYPLDPELRSLRQEMILRAKVDNDETQDLRQSRKRRFRNLTVRFAVIAILVILAIFVVQTYSNWFQQQVASAQQEVEYQLVRLDLDVKMRDAKDYVRAGQAEPALVLLNEIEAVDSDYPELDATKDEALQLQSLDDKYIDALNLIEAGDLTGALVVLEEIESQEPYYRDVKNRILQIQDQTLLGDQLRDADEKFANEQWEEAAEAYYSLYSLNPDYQTAHVEDRLFSSYVNAAETLLNTSDTIEATEKVEDYFQRALALRPQEPEVKEKQARIRSMIEERLFRSYVFLAQSAIVEETNTLEGLIIADKYFTEALRLKPNDPEVTIQRELAHQFVKGQDNFLNGAYSDSIESMEFILGQDPGFASGAARQTLYEAYVARGDSSMAIGSFESALEDFQRAAVIANEDPSSTGRLYEIQMRIAEAQGLLGNYDTAVNLYQSAIAMADLQARANQYSTAMAAALIAADEYASQGNLREAFRNYREAVTWAYQVFDVTVHVVTSDDYLSQLALDYNSTVNLIATANNLANPNIIIPGQELLIPILP